jgi:hypothetical protein
MKSLPPIVLLVSISHACAGAAEVRLTEAGRTRQAIVVSPQASADVQAAAATLADYLGRISGAKFDVRTGDGASGIVVGRAADFPALQIDPPFNPADPTRREEYVLRSHADGLWLLGATDLAVRHAVWDCLYRLGYRQYFPGPTWEIVPRSPALRLDVDDYERPAYHSRRIWYGYGPWD